MRIIIRKEGTVQEGEDDTIQHKILDPLAMKILNKEFGEGDSIEVDVEESEIVFRKGENDGN